MPQTPETTGAILIVDDSSDDTILTKYALKKLKLTNPVRAVATGEQMVEYMEGVGPYADRARFPYPTLILLDLKLPQMDGRQAQAWLRSTKPHRQIPIFVMSNDMCVDLLEAAVACGAEGYLVKPIAEENFHALCQQMNVRLQATDSSQN